jgi:hypothetical protein
MTPNTGCDVDPCGSRATDGATRVPGAPMDLRIVVVDEHDYALSGCLGDRISATVVTDSPAPVGADVHGAYCSTPIPFRPSAP